MSQLVGCAVVVYHRYVIVFSHVVKYILTFSILTTLAQAIDVLANMRGIETLYLHVDVENEGALALYEKAVYRKVDNNEPMFLEFTTKLNLHDGATKGRNHFLLYKDLVPCPTWLPLPATTSTSTPEPSSVTIVSSGFATTSSRASTTAGALGFEVPAC